MKKPIVVFSILLFFSALNLAWAGGNLLWQSQVNLGGNDRSVAVVADRDRVYAVGRVRAPNQSPDWFVRAYDALTGDIVWSDQFDAGGLFDAAYTVALDGGRVFVGGESELVPGNFDWLVRVYDARTGGVLWQDRFDLAGGEEYVNDVAASGERVIAIGGGVGIFGNEDVIVRVYSPEDGTVLSSGAFGGPGGGGQFGGDDEGSSVVIEGTRAYITAILAHDGTCKILTSTPFLSGNCDFAVAAGDILTGDPAWFDIVDIGGDFDAAGSIAVRGGRVVAVGIATPAGYICQADSTGETGAGGNCDFFVRAYDADTGVVLWTDQYDRDFGGFDQAGRVALDDRRAFVTGFTAKPGGNCTNPFAAGGNCDFTVRAYSIETGTILWKDEFDRAGGFDSAAGIAVRGGRVVASGRVQSNAVFDIPFTSPYQDMLVRSYNAATGAVMWQDQFDLASGHDRASGSLAAELSRVFIVGRATNGNGDQDFIVRAYQW